MKLISKIAWKCFEIAIRVFWWLYRRITESKWFWDYHIETREDLKSYQDIFRQADKMYALMRQD